MKQIPLTRGQFALVDDADYEWLMQWKWHAVWMYKSYRAIRKITLSGHGKNRKREAILMSRLIMGLKKGDPRNADHHNHNTLDNQRHNLRVCTHQENQMNMRVIKKNTTSKYKGVFWVRSRQIWQAKIKHRGRQIYLGQYADEIEAARVVDAAAIKYRGEFACLNFPQGYKYEIAISA